jgi:hypothetical protein
MDALNFRQCSFSAPESAKEFNPNHCIIVKAEIEYGRKPTFQNTSKRT